MAKRKVNVPVLESYYGRPAPMKAMLLDDFCQMVNEWEEAHPNHNESPYGFGMVEMEVDDDA